MFNALNHDTSEIVGECFLCLVPFWWFFKHLDGSPNVADTCRCVRITLEQHALGEVVAYNATISACSRSGLWQEAGLFRPRRRREHLVLVRKPVDPLNRDGGAGFLKRCILPIRSMGFLEGFLKGNHHLQVAMLRCCHVRIPVRAS